MDITLSKLRNWWWTGKPGTLQSVGSQRVGHDWATELNWTELCSRGKQLFFQAHCRPWKNDRKKMFSVKECINTCRISDFMGGEIGGHFWGNDGFSGADLGSWEAGNGQGSVWYIRLQVYFFPQDIQEGEVWTYLECRSLCSLGIKRHPPPHMKMCSQTLKLSKPPILGIL